MLLLLMMMTRSLARISSSTNKPQDHFIDGADDLRKELKSRLDELLNDARLTDIVASKTYFNPPAWVMESNGGCTGAPQCDSKVNCKYEF